MADATVDNGALADIDVSSKTLTGGQEIQGVELVTAVEGGARTDLAKAEDTAHASGDMGIQMLAVRRDTAAALGADGDYVPLIVDNEGKVWANVAAAARTLDSVAVALQTDVMMNNLTALTPKFFSATVAASQTDSQLVALVASKKIRVIALAVQCGGTATDVTFESSTTTRKHKVPAGANGGQILGPNPWGWFETAAGESLTCTTGAGSSTEISGVYVEV